VGQRRHGKENENHQLGTEFFGHHKIASAVRVVEFVNDRMSYTVQRNRWCNIIVFNAHLLSEEKVMIQKTVFMWNRSTFSNIFLSTI
jgi:hypothetical protein